MKGVTRLPAQQCPLCGKTIDAHGTVDKTDVAPRPGDWSVCAGCFQWLRYDAFLALRAVTNKEWLALTDDDRIELTRQQAMVKAAFGKGRAS
jgi:hypothetical protein